MQFSHSLKIWDEFPELVAGVILAGGISPRASVGALVERYTAAATARLASGSEGEMPEVQAWRRAFARMGMKPTQYRCASEALLRRYRKEGELPRLHPLIDLCNAISLAFAIPVAVFDTARIAGSLEVRHATGREAYLAFSGEMERPEPGEVIFVDRADNAHARRWTHRQSAASAVRDDTATVLIVAEAIHGSAVEDVAGLMAALGEGLSAG